MTAALATGLLQGAALLAVAPLVPGVMSKLRARLEGRRGAPVFQPYYNIFKFLRKESLAPADSTWIFRMYPPFAVAILALILFALPAFLLPATASFAGDVLLVVFLLAMIRFGLALAALDTGTPFAGLGASREMSLSSLVEPATILALFALAISAGTTDIGQIVGVVAATNPSELGPSHILACGALFIVMIAETGRVPVDNPSTHLELTMIHEAMVLEYSGWRLALIEYASALKLLTFITLLASIFFPWGMATSPDAGGVVVGIAVYIFKAGLILSAVVLIEAAFAKLRLFRVPDLIGAALMLAILAVVAIFIGLG